MVWNIRELTNKNKNHHAFVINHKDKLNWLCFKFEYYQEGREVKKKG